MHLPVSAARQRRSGAMIACALAGVLLAAGCGTSGPASAPSTPSAPASHAAPSSAATGKAPAPPSSSGASSAAAPHLSLTHLTFSIPVSSGLQVLPQLALEAGYFKQQGLDVTITHIPGSQAEIAAMTAGQLDMSNTDSPTTIQAHLGGVPTVIVAVPVTKPIFDFVVPDSITQPSQLRGKTVAVSRVGSSTYFQVSLALKSWGLTPQKDVKLEPLGDYPGMYAGLTNGQLQGAPLPPPFNFRAEGHGYHALADLTKLPIDYPTAVVQTTEQFAAQHPDVVLAFLKAYVEAIHRYKTDEAFTTKVYEGFLKSNNVPLIHSTWQYYSKLLNSDPTPTANGIHFVLQNLAQMGHAAAAKADPNSFINTTFMAKLKSDGFLQQVESQPA